MSEPQWMPANPVEHALAEALDGGDGVAFAEQLRAAQLLLPELPSAGSEDEQRIAQLFPPGGAFVPVYTSPDTMAWALGEFATEYEPIDFASLLQRWPDTEHQLAINPGTPIATFLTPQSITDLAEGREALVSMEDVQHVVSDEAVSQIRDLCLRELAGEETPALPVAEPAELRDDPPGNEVESVLLDAVQAADGEAYLRALLDGASVLLLTNGPVSDPDKIFDEGFPWRVLGGDQAAVIPVFTSAAMLERTGATDGAWVEVDFLHVLAMWPSEDHMLFVNLGSALELSLPGEVVLDVVAAMADTVDDPATRDD